MPGVLTLALRLIYAALLTLFAALAWEANDRAARTARQARAQEAKFMDQSQQLDAATTRLVGSVKSELQRATEELAAANARTTQVDLQPMIDRITGAADSLDAAFPASASGASGSGDNITGVGAAGNATLTNPDGSPVATTGLGTGPTAIPTGVDPSATPVSAGTGDVSSTPAAPADASPAPGDTTSAALGDSQADASGDSTSGASGADGGTAPQ